MTRGDRTLFYVVGGAALLGALGVLRGRRFSLAELTTLARRTGFADPELAAAIAMAESGGRADQVTREPFGSTSLGLWQIHLSDHPEFDPVLLLSPAYNARAALAISQGGTDFHLWSTFNHGDHLPYYRKAGT